MGFLLDFVAWAVGGVLSLVVAVVCPPLTWMAANPLTTVATGAVVALALWLRSKSNRELLLGGGRRRLKVEAPAECADKWAAGKKVEPSLRDPKDDKVIRCYDPCSGRLLGSGSATAMSAEEVKAAVGRARKAQASWAQTSFEQRREFLRLLMDFVVENQEDLCRVASRDTGKTLVDGAFGEILTTCEKLKWTIDHGEQALQPEYRAAGSMMMHKRARVEYLPMGVLAAIIPWNYPFHNIFGQVISAVFAGNAIVIKVSEHACWSSAYYGRILRAALEQLGHDPDLVQLVTGYGETGAALINSGVDKLTFIGSPGVGKLVMKAAADTLTPVVLELGGKDAAVVCEDCDFDQVTNMAMRGTFQNCGQNCCGLERLVVHERIYDRFVEDMKKRVNALTQGPPLDGEFDCGAMTMGERQMAGIKELVDDAVAKGARLLAGGKPNSKLADGSFFEPTLLADVTPEMDIARNEVFGPVMVIMKAKSDEDAVRIVNACDYGLGSSVFSADYARAEKIGRALRTGMCNINDFGVNYLCQSLPFGGVKISGFDRFAGIEGLRGCCLVKAVTTDKLAAMKTTIPPPLQYPIKRAGFDFTRALIGMFYGDGLAARAKAIFNLARIAIRGQ